MSMHDSVNTDQESAAGFVLVEVEELHTTSESDLNESSGSELTSSFLEHTDDETTENSDESDNMISGNFQCFDWRSNNTPSSVSRL